MTGALTQRFQARDARNRLAVGGHLHHLTGLNTAQPFREVGLQMTH